MKHFEFLVARRYLWALRNNLSNSVVALFSAAGVTVGTWLLVFVLSAINGFEHEVKQQLMGKDAHLEVTLYHFDPMGNYDSLAKVIQSQAEVVSVSPFIMTKTIISRGKAQDGIVLMGIDPIRSQGVIDLQSTIKQGSYNLDSALDEKGKMHPSIILGWALAARLGAEIGDKVFLADFTGSGGLSAGQLSPRIGAFVLTATFESGMYQYDENLAYLSLEASQKMFGMRGEASGIQVKLKDPERSGEVARHLEEHLGYPYRALDWKTKNFTLIKWMGYEKVLVALALAIIIIIAAFNIISSLVMAVNDKRREIGILRAMGATRSSIMRIFMVEGSLIGLLGSCTGLALGLFSYWIQWRFKLITLPGDVYFVTVLPVRLDWIDVVSVMVGTNILCLLATVLPSLRAAHHNPLEAIRHE